MVHYSLYGREYSGEIGLFGETVFNRFGGSQGKLPPRWEECENVGISELTGEHLICDERGAHAARTTRSHAPSGRQCGCKIRRIVGTPESPKPAVVAHERVTWRKKNTRGMVDRHGPSDECSRCETEQGSHSEECRLRFDTVRLPFLTKIITEMRGADFIVFRSN